jgi:hypothetical protein
VELVLHQTRPKFPHLKLSFRKLLAPIALLLLLMTAVYAQDTNAEKVVLVNGTTDSTVFGLGNSVRITGTVKQGAMSLGGDVIVEGVVEGDVATIGGSVIQLPGSSIGGDVIVLGGTYRAPGAIPVARRSCTRVTSRSSAT